MTFKTFRNGISWSRVLTEAATIIFSILVAFSIDAWWEQQKQRVELANSLHNLRGFLVEYLEEVEGNINYVAPDQVLLAQFLDINAEDEINMSDNARWETLRSIWRPATFDLNSGYIVRALDSASLKSLRNNELQIAFAQWQGALDTLNEHRFGLKNHEDKSLLLLAAHAEIADAFGKEREQRTAISVSALKALRQDREVVALAARKSLMNRVHISVLANVRDATRLVLQELEKATDSK